ncbi:MAG: hypothetical protein KF758_12870 [Anaerolineales bacterium]|nr:hypothetical protein [Anaerolineales bacterium]
MSINLVKENALKYLGQKIRQQYGLPYQKEFVFTNNQLEEIKKSLDPVYIRFFEAYEGGIPKPGGHPDYNHLANPENVGNYEEGEITAFYMDLKNFTKYCLFMKRERVYPAKAVAIEAVIDVCRLYDGHLHEIPGDGVLVFFGGKSSDNIQSANYAIQAACDAMNFLIEEVIPEYNSDSNYPDIFPKMGIDTGAALWAAYGSKPHYEVKATSFNVDIASKMMKDCNSRQIKIGDDLKTKLEIDEQYLDLGWIYDKDMTIEGKKHEKKYKTWFFNWEKYRNNEMKKGVDLAKLGMSNIDISITESKSKLGDAPLA